MPQTILGLDIGETAVAAVLLEKGLKGRRMLACARAPVGEPGAVGEAIREIAGRMDLRADECRTAVPAEQASYRQVRLPFRDVRKLRQALPFELEPSLPFPIEEVLVDFSRHPKDQPGTVLAAAVSRVWIAERLALLGSVGVDPAVLDIRGVPIVSWLMDREETPDAGLFLDMDGRRPTLILFGGRRIVLIRSLAPHTALLNGAGGPGAAEGNAECDPEAAVTALCRDIRNTLHAFESYSPAPIRPETVFITGAGSGLPGGPDPLSEALGVPVREVRLREEAEIRMDRRVQASWDGAAMTHALALALRGTRSSAGFDFRRDGFEAKSASFLGLRRELRTAAFFLFLVISMLAVDLGLEHHRLTARSDALDRAIAEVFLESFPGTARVVVPLHQMKVNVAELRRSASPGSTAARVRGTRAIDLLKDMSERIPPNLDVRLSRLVLDAHMVRIGGKTDTFNTVETLTAVLEAAGSFRSAGITSAALDREGGGVRFEIILERAYDRPAGDATGQGGSAAGRRQGTGT